MSCAGGSHHKNHAGLVLQYGLKNQNEPSYMINSSYFDTDGYRDYSSTESIKPILKRIHVYFLMTT